MSHAPGDAPTDPEGVPDIGAIASAARLGALLGESVPDAVGASKVPEALADAARDLLDAVVSTAVDEAEQRRVTALLRDATVALRATQRDPVIALVRHPDGRLENLTQAGSGRWNPRAPALRFPALPEAPRPGAPFRPVEVIGTVALGASCGGGPSRAHGGVVAGVLDEALGVAAAAAGVSGLTVAVEVRYRAGTPLGVPLRVTARCDRVEGRKRYASGELWHDAQLLAEATAVYVAERED